MEIKNKINVKPTKVEKTYGHLNLESKDVPEIKNMKLNEEVEFVIKLKVKSLRAPDKWEIAEKYKKPEDLSLSGDITSISLKKGK